MIALAILILGWAGLSLGQLTNVTVRPGGNTSIGPVGPPGGIQRIPFGNLTKTRTFFESKGVLKYDTFLYDYLKDQIIIGGRDTLIRMDPDLRLIEKYDVPAPADALAKCKSNHTEEDCHNFIPVLHIFDDNVNNESVVYACGTNGFDPKCLVRDANQLSATQKAKDFPGENRAPKSPAYKGICASWLNPDNNLLFVGTMFDENLQTSNIAVSEMSTKAAYQPQIIGGSSFLSSSAEFAGTFQERQLIFFVFAEIAIEKPDEAMSSTVARLCADGDKGDLGLVSYTKARIKCGEYTKVKGVFYLEDEHRLFATFTKENQGLTKSAICLYDYANISSAFEGGFLCNTGGSTWENCPPRPLGNHNVTTCYGERNAEDARDRILTNTTVLPFCEGPMFESANGSVSFGQITVQRAVLGHYDYKVYVGDDLSGTVWNINLGPYCGQAEAYEIWEVTREEDRKYSLKIPYVKILYGSVYVLTCCTLLKSETLDYVPTTEGESVPPTPHTSTTPKYPPPFPPAPGQRTGKPGPKGPGTLSCSSVLSGSWLLAMALATFNIQ